MAKRTSRTTDQNKEQLKAIVDELKANKVQESENVVKLQTVLESLVDQTKKLVTSIDKLSIRTKSNTIESNIEGNNVSSAKVQNALTDNKSQTAAVQTLDKPKVQDSENDTKLSSVIESLSDQIKKLTLSVDKLSVKPKKDVKSGFEGSGVSPTKNNKDKVEKTEKKPGFMETSGKFLKENKGFLMGGAALAFLLNPKAALSVLEGVLNTASNILNVIGKFASGEWLSGFGAILKTITDNPVIVAIAGLVLGKKISNLVGGVFDVAKGAVNTVKKIPGAVTATVDAVKAAPAAAKAAGKTVVSTLGGAANTVKDVAETGLAKVAATTPVATSTAGGVLNTIKGVAETGLAKVASVLPPSLVSGASTAATVAKDAASTGLAKAASVMPTGVTSIIKGAGEVAGGLISKITSTLAPLATLPGVKTFLKAIPGLGLLLSIGSAAMRVADGDYIGAAIELASGVAGLFPGLGTAAALGLQGVNFARDKAAEKAEERMNRGANPVDKNKLIPDNRPDTGNQQLVPGGGGGGGSKPAAGSPGEPAKVLNSDAPKGLEAGTKKLRNAHLSIDYGDSVKTGGTKSWRNNNPGNIRYGDYAKSQGAIGKDKDGFAVFPDEATGDKAREKLLFEGKNYKDLSVSAAITRYAPPSENNTAAYIADVSKAIGVDPNTKMSDLSPEQRQKMMAAMKKKEGYEAGVVTAKEGGSKITPEMAKDGITATAKSTTPAGTAAPIMSGTPGTPVSAAPTTVTSGPKVAAPDKPKTETAALQTDLNKTKSEVNSKPTVVVAGGGGGGGGSSSSNVTNNNVTNVNRPDYLSKDLTAPFSFGI